MTDRLRTIAVGFCLMAGSVAFLTFYVVHVTTVAINQAHYASVK